MPVTVPPNEVQIWIEESLRQRPDIGLRKAIANMFFDSANPFDPKTPRKPKAGFLVGTILFAVSLACFCYFNITR
jgi:hypothetical protein